MKNTVICAVLWIATVVGAWALGNGSSGDDQPDLVDADIATLELEIERLLALLEEHAPGLASAGSGTRPDGDEPRATIGGTQSRSDVGVQLDTFSPDTVADPHEMLSMLRMYAREMFAKGKPGHLQLLQTVDQLMKIEGLEDRLGQRDEERWRYLYPMVRFLVQNEKHVVDMMETVYEEMARNPNAFEDLDNDVIEIFADEGIGPILPALVGPERLERFRTLAQQILDTPEDQQSDAIRRSRNEIERSIALWWPEVSKEEAFERLRGTGTPATEVLAYLRKLDPDQLRQLDLGRLLGAAIEAGDRSAVGFLGTIDPDVRLVGELDDAVVRAALAGNIQGWLVAQYLGRTKRETWEEARGFIERGLGVGTRATAVFTDAVRYLHERPDRDWVVWMLDTYTIDRSQADRLRRDFKID